MISEENNINSEVNKQLSYINAFYLEYANKPASTNEIIRADVINSGKEHIAELKQLRGKVEQFFNKNQDCFECHKLMSNINHMISDIRGLLFKKYRVDPIGGKRKYKSRRHRKTSHRRKTNRRRRKTNRRKY
jgi:hypothetical protein